MRRIYSIILAVFLLSLSFSYASSETLTPEQIEQIRAEKQAQIEAYKQRLRAEKQGEIESYQERLRAEKQLRIDQYREASQEEKERLREQYMLNLGEIRDERKAAIVEKIDGQVATINSRWTSHWGEVLDRLTLILAKISERADTLEDDGVDVSQVRLAIEEAESAISEAQAALEAQAAKDYVIDINGEATVGQDVRNAVSDLQAELNLVKDLILDAKTQVREAFVLLKQAVNSVPVTVVDEANE